MGIRIAAVTAAIVLIGIAWYLGSPLFIRTSANEAVPTASVRLPSTPPDPSASASTRIALPVQAPTVLRRGQLEYVDSLHHGNGKVVILDVDGRLFLRFEDVAITNAPDVHVYLAQSRDGVWSEQFSTYIGPLKATDGSFNYELPPNLDVAAYGSVVVWCRMFSVLVTWANLERP